MGNIPPIWRTETYHAVSVHFPIGILSLAALISILYLLIRNKQFSTNLRFTLSLLLWIGVVCFWCTFYTGRQAYSVVVRTICDPFVLKDHLYYAWIAGYAFSISVLFDVVYNLIQKRRKRIFNLLTILFLIIGAGILGFVGHLGANVVYQQAGGVYIPTENCEGF